jgi:plasmid stabilization system protein ParE
VTTVYSPLAEADLLEALRFLSERSPRAAARVAERIFETVRRLEMGDFDGPEQTLAGGERVRSWPVPPWRVYYQRRGDALHIVRIYHHARRPMAQEPEEGT